MPSIPPFQKANKNSLNPVFLRQNTKELRILKRILELGVVMLLEGQRMIPFWLYSHVPINSTVLLTIFWRCFLLFLALNCYLLACLMPHLNKN